MNVVRIMVAMMAAASVLAAGAAAGGVFDFPRVPGSAQPARTAEIAMSDGLRVAGQPMQLSLFETPDAPARVARFYLDAFRARSLVPVTAIEPDLAHVSAFDPTSGLQRFVSAIARGKGQTLVLIGSTDSRRPPRLVRGEDGISIPIPPGQQQFLGYRSEDGGARAESAQFVIASPPDEVAAFYRRALREQGYSERHDGAGEGMLTFDGAGATISVALRALERKSGAAVFVTRIEGGTPR
jgi:hypothetical protein